MEDKAKGRLAQFRVRTDGVRQALRAVDPELSGKIRESEGAFVPCPRRCEGIDRDTVRSLRLLHCGLFIECEMRFPREKTGKKTTDGTDGIWRKRVGLVKETLAVDALRCRAGEKTGEKTGKKTTDDTDDTDGILRKRVGQVKER